MSDLTNPPLTIPAGTQVVARAAVRDAAGVELALAGAVGVVVAVPERVDGAYIVRLPAGREVALRRDELSIRKAQQREGVLPAAPAPDELRPYIIYRCVVGSRAYGFLSKQLYQTYNGYVLAQFRRIEQDLRTHGAIRTKHAMHLIRLLLSGIIALREGTIPVLVTEHREQLLAIKRGELPWDAVNAWRLALHREFDATYAATALPEQPDSAAVDDFLIRARRSMVKA
jgi:hypothetical protein